VRVNGYRYKKNGKTITVKAHNRKGKAAKKKK
jgi:hypothetical protein